MYNKSIPVTKAQYDGAKKKFEGYIAHRQEGEAYFIKLIAPGRGVTAKLKKFLNIE